MRQLSLFTPDEHGDLAGTMPAMRAAMRRAAEEDGRKILPERMTAIAKQHQISLGSGTGKGINEATLHKWMSPTDESRPPSLLGSIVFCRATSDPRPMLVLVLALGRELATQLVMLAAKALNIELMTEEDRKYRDIGRASIEAKKARKRLKRLEEDL